MVQILCVLPHVRIMCKRADNGRPPSSLPRIARRPTWDCIGSTPHMSMRYMILAHLLGRPRLCRFRRHEALEPWPPAGLRYDSGSRAKRQRSLRARPVCLNGVKLTGNPSAEDRYSLLSSRATTTSMRCMHRVATSRRDDREKSKTRGPLQIISTTVI